MGALRNWAGNVTFGAARRHQPESVDELRKLVAASPRIRALGTGHSFNRIADSPGDLVSVARLPRAIRVDAERATVTVSAGVRYGELAQHLHAAGYALPNLGSLPHISVAGACATATHGSGDRNGNLATAVAAITLVTADGDLREVRESSEDFAGMVVGLGCFGVVTSLTLRVVPTYQIRQYVYDDMPRTAVDAKLGEIFASAYSVSLFTHWSGGAISQVWLKLGEGEVPPPPRWLGASRADTPRHPIAGMPTEYCTAQLGAAGPWHERLPHFRLEFTPSNGDELQSEYFVPRDRAVEALAAVDRLRHLIGPVLQISELRSVAADELWLSPAYQRDSVAIHFTWQPDAERVGVAVAALEEALTPYEARPHWGKLFATAPEVIGQRYPRLADFRRLAASLDPAGKFRNEFIDRYVGA